MKKTKKVPGFSLAIVIVLFFMILGFLFVFLSSMLRERQMDILTLKRDNAVNELSNQFQEVESIILTLSSTIQEGVDQTTLENIMIDIDDNQPIITQLYFGRPDKSYIITADFNEPANFDITERPWYKAAQTSGDMTYTDAYIDAVLNVTIMSVVYPIYDGNSLVGVLGADIEVDSMTAFINDIIDENIGFAFVLDSRGYILALSSMDETFDQLVTSTDHDIPFDTLSNGEGITDTLQTFAGRGKIAYQTIDCTDFVFGIFMSSSEINQNIVYLTTLGLALLALTLSTIIILGLIYNRLVYKPLSLLIADIESINVASETQEHIDIDAKAGYRQARLALNQLIDVSKGYQLQLKKSFEEIEYENQKFKLVLSSSPDIVVVLDKHKRYQEVYGNVKDIFGIDEKSFVGKTHREIFGDYYADLRNTQYNRTLKGETVVYSWKHIRRGKTLHFETINKPMYDNHHHIIGIVGVSRDITEQEERYNEMLYISTHDYLTGLYNRKTYDEKLVELREKGAYPFALINMDLNGLKLINDAYGHHFGDVAIEKTASILKKSVGKEDFVSRVGGDEFTVIIPNATKRDVNSFKRQLKLNFKGEKINHMDLSIAAGYYIVKDSSITIDEVKKLAENDMYKEKIKTKDDNNNNAIKAILQTVIEKSEIEKTHCSRVEVLAFELGKAMDLSKEDLSELRKAAKFHDIGKITIPDEIGFKPTTLTHDEFDIVKTHTQMGYDLLKSARDYSRAAIYALSHHEWFDGSGYPNGLQGDAIPLFARIIAVVDAYEAMTFDRSYRKRLTEEEAIKELREFSNRQFDPEIVSIFIEKVLERKKLDK